MLILLLAITAVVAWLWPWEPWPGVNGLALVGTLAGISPMLRGAVRAVAQRRMNMELSMTIALAAALAVGESLTALVLTISVLVAEYLEELTVDRGRRALADLLAMMPRRAWRQSAGELTEVDVATLVPGDVVVVRPGAQTPVDGTVVAGHSFVDEAAITGESQPAEKLPGGTIYAGAMNQSGVLEVRTTHIGRDTAFGKILQTIEQAEATRAPLQKLADRLAGRLVYIALAVAAVTLVVQRDVMAAVSVIIVAGACGVAAGTPLAILGAVGQAARFGAIFKGGLHLEQLGAIDTIVLDKTGTLTLGQPVVSQLCPAAGVTAADLLATAAAAERGSEHPLARAVERRAQADGVAVPQPERFESQPGQGVTCWINGEPIVVGNRDWLSRSGVLLAELPAACHAGTEILVARSGQLLGAVHVSDELRPEAAAAVCELQSLGLRTVLLTGDVPTVAQEVAERLGVDEFAAQLLPHEKVARIEALQAAGRQTAMVGDGLNDAPALTAARVGVALGTGADVTQECADVVLLGSDLSKLPRSIRLARQCRRIIFQNFYGTLLIDGVGMALAATQYLPPLAAAAIHVASETAFLLNSARLLPRGKE